MLGLWKFKLPIYINIVNILSAYSNSTFLLSYITEAKAQAEKLNVPELYKTDYSWNGLTLFFQKHYLSPLQQKNFTCRYLKSDILDKWEDIHWVRVPYTWYKVSQLLSYVSR